jgi:hypothetical protein
MIQSWIHPISSFLPESGIFQNMEEIEIRKGCQHHIDVKCPAQPCADACALVRGKRTLSARVRNDVCACTKIANNQMFSMAKAIWRTV